MMKTEGPTGEKGRTEGAMTSKTMMKNTLL